MNDLLPPSTSPPPLRQDFTWFDSLILLPTSIILVVPLSILNALSVPGGYQKLIPQMLIPEDKRINIKYNVVESIFV